MEQRIKTTAFNGLVYALAVAVAEHQGFLVLSSPAEQFIQINV